MTIGSPPPALRATPSPVPQRAGVIAPNQFFDITAGLPNPLTLSPHEVGEGVAKPGEGFLLP